jgi:hypothetical protein
MTESTTIPERRTYTFGAPATSMLVNLDLPRAIALMGALVFAFAMMLSGQLVIALASILTGAALSFTRPGGRPAIHWIGPITGFLTRPHRSTRQLPTGELDIALAADPRHRGSGGSGEPDDPAKRPARAKRRHTNTAPWPLPLGVPNLTTVKLAGQDTAAWWHGRGKRPLVSVAWVAELPHSFPLLGRSDQERFLDAWGQVLAGTAGQGSAVRRVSVIQRQVPDASNEAQEWIAEHPSDVDMMMRKDYMELIEQMGAAAATSEVLVGITCEIPLRANVDPLLLEAEQFQARMETAGFAMSPLSAGRFGAYLSSLLEGTPLANTPSSDPTETGPLATEETWSTLRIDGRIHKTYVVAAWPRVQVGPTWLEPLLTTPIANAIRTTAIHFEPVPSDRAMKKARTGVTAAEMAMQRKAEKSITVTSADRQVQEHALRREQALTYGHAEHHLMALTSISVASDEAMERATRTLEHAASKSNVVIKPAYATQAQAFAAMLPLGLVTYPQRILG